MIENQINLIRELIQTPLGIFELMISITIRLSVFFLFIAILINFIQSGKQKNIKSEKKSIVETGSMILFFLVFYLLLKSEIGVIDIINLNLKIILIIFGTAIIVFGTIFNILGRFSLGKNWANQVKIYTDQTLVQNGVYKIVRHPLYASLIWMFFGASLVFQNYLAFLLNLLIFIPFMFYRAKQEESALSNQFNQYKLYQQKVGMFFPKIGGKIETN